MKVVFITHYPALYGANRSLVNLIEGLMAYDVKSHVISPVVGDITRKVNDLDIPVAVMPMAKWMTHPSKNRSLNNYLRWRGRTIRNLLINLYSLPKLIRTIRGWNIDIVYTNSSVIPSGAVAARFLRLTHIWHLRELGLLHYRLRHDWGERTFRYLIGIARAIIANSNTTRSTLLTDGG